MSESPTFSTISGKWVILVMVGLGVLAAGFASYYRSSFTRGVLSYWGGREANTITTAPQVTLFELEAADATAGGSGENAAHVEAGNGAEKFTWLGREFHPLRQIDLSKAGGLAHAREALIQDSGYVWDAKPQRPTASDRVWLLRFKRSGNAATLVFIDLKGRILGNDNKREVLRMGETLRAGLEKFIDEKAAEASPDPNGQENAHLDLERSSISGT